MTDIAVGGRIGAPPSRLSKSGALVRLAWRSLRGDAAGLGVFIACIALGVAAIVGVGSVSRSFSDGLAAQSRTLLGGDASFSVMHAPLGQDAIAWLEARGVVAKAAEMRAMARKVDGSRTALVALKVVDHAWPNLGQAVVQPSRPVQDLLAKSNGFYGLVADPSLAARLGLSVGDRVTLGDETFELRAALVSEPDGLASGLTLGPRVLMSEDALAATGLAQPGSLIRWTYKVALNRPPPGGAEPDAAAFVAQADEAFPRVGWETRTRDNVSPQIAQSSKQLSQFLILVALTALMVGGIGVANGARAYVDRKMADFATLKAIGATGGAVFSIAMIQLLALAGLGAAIGLIAGAAAPFALAAVLSGQFQIPFQPALYPKELELGALYGLLSAFAFSAGPVGRAHDAPVAALFRSRFQNAQAGLPRARYVAMVASAFLALFVLTLATAGDRRIVDAYVVAALVAVAALRAVAWAIERAIRRAPRTGPAELRLALTDLRAPGALTATVVLSLGLGLTLLTAIALVDGNLRDEIGQSATNRTPSLFFLDIPAARDEAFRSFVASSAPTASLEEAPMLRGRVVALNGKPPIPENVASSASWVLNGDRGLTYSAEPPPGARLVAGSWWSKDYQGPPLVSLDAAAARGLNLKIGDTVTVNALGRDITAKIANLRDVDWRSLGINFVFVFSPDALRSAPHTILGSAAYPPDAPADVDLDLMRRVADSFPTVSVVRVKDAIDMANALLDKVAFAIRCASSVVLAAAALALAGAIASGQRNRIYNAVILKTIGATRAQLLGALALEYALLGCAAAVVGVGAGGLAAYLVLTRVLDLAQFTWLWTPIAVVVLTGLGVALALGTALTFRALGQKPSSYLRSD